jgi:tRNA U34 5-methylaminomethyl-2-thiouridine-forming methyltransferase MnmC
MQREFRLTEDGSHTLYVPELNEHYHSINGALSESKHIFIDAALNFCKKEEPQVLEIGFGTGLNAFLSCLEVNKQDRKLHYHAIEKYPLTMDEARLLNYDSLLDNSDVSILDFHSTPWEETRRIHPDFFLHKERSDIREIKAKGVFDVIYFDAFSPDIQPELWSPEVFKKIADLTASGGILTTYSVKGDIKRALIAAGFSVEKIPGPYGKRVILRAIKN